MPLFMDFHKIDNVTIEAVKAAHIADKAIQDKYGVKYHQFWVNEEAGTVFCLTEGPDKETCEMVHQMAHGNIACAMTQVETGFYKTMMGEGHKVENGLVINSNGTVDLGYRSILVVSVHHPSVRKVVSKKLREFAGREIKWASDDSLISIFNDSMDAVECALEITQALQAESEAGEKSFKIGISASQPVTKEGDFFSEAILLAQRLCKVAPENTILLSSLVKRLCKDEILAQENGLFLKVIEETDENFITKVVTITENKMSDEGFSVDVLCRKVGLSRPQLYRKIVSLTGRSPIDLIREIRMEKAFNLLKSKSHNISEVALEVGYNNASYFAKCFSERFGLTPSEFVSGV